MTRERAQRLAAERNRELPQGADHQWIVHHVGGDRWDVARFSAGGMRFTAGDRHTTTEARPEPRPDQDPRTTITRLIPPYGPS